MVDFPAIVTFARFFFEVLYYISLWRQAAWEPFHTDPFGRFLGVLISPIAEGICISLLEFSFVLLIVDPNS